MDDAKEKGSEDGEMIVVVSRREKAKVPAKVIDTVSKGMG